MFEFSVISVTRFSSSTKPHDVIYGTMFANLELQPIKIKIKSIKIV